MKKTFGSILTERSATRKETLAAPSVILITRMLLLRRELMIATIHVLISAITSQTESAKHVTSHVDIVKVQLQLQIAIYAIRLHILTKTHLQAILSLQQQMVTGCNANAQRGL